MVAGPQYFREHGSSNTRDDQLCCKAGQASRPTPSLWSDHHAARETGPSAIAGAGAGPVRRLRSHVSGSFSLENPHFSADDLFALRDDGADTLLGAALIIANAAYADPSKLDAAMPCFRLGAFGTESQRHKRVNGLFAAVFADESAGELLLSEAARRLGRLGLTHIAAQAPSNVPTLCAFFDTFFDRQGEFPILVRPLSLGVSTAEG